MQLSWQAFTIPALCAAMLVHGAFSSPAPQSFGLAEGAIALCLLIAAAPRLPEFLDAKQLLQNPARAAWLWLLLVPLMIGILAGHRVRDYSRDAIAIIFLGLPMLAGGALKRPGQLALAIAVAGAAMALRYWLITDSFSALRYLYSGDELLYLALDPAMTFAAVYFPILFIENIFSGQPRANKFLISGFCLVASVLCYGALAGMMMRGAMALAMISLCLYALMQWRRPGMPLIMGITALAVIAIFFEPLLRVAAELWQKTQAVGLNARDADFMAIWQIQSQSPLAFLFGQGWGAVYSSPAVGGYWVNYSHSAAGFYFLKTGLIGVALLVFYLWRILEGGGEKGEGRLFFSPLPLLFAAAPPLLLAFTLYTSYKFFSCGMLLLLLSSAHAYPDPQPHPTPRRRSDGTAVK